MLAGIDDVFGRRQPRAIEPRQRRGDILRRALGEQRLRQHQILRRGLFGEQRILQHALLVELADFIGLRRGAPDRVDAGEIEQHFRAPLARRRHQQNADALAAGAAGAAGAMLHHFRIVRDIGMDHEIEVRQIDAARGDVGGDADAGAAVAQRLQRVGALVLGQFARQRDDGKAALRQRRLQMPHRLARVAEHQRARRFKEAQRVDDRMVDIAGRDPDGAVFDVGMAAFVAADLDAKRLLLILLGQRDDDARQRRREQQRAAGFRRGLEDEFHILAKTEIEHFVGLVEHDGLQFRNVETAAPQMIAQPPRRADHDVGARGELALLAARIHAADAGDHARIGIVIEPGEFAMDLQAPVRASARRSAPAAPPPARTARHRRAVHWQSPAHRRRSCRSRSAPRPAGRGRRPRPPARRSAPASGNRSCARPKLGRAAGLWSGMSRGSDLHWRMRRKH